MKPEKTMTPWRTDEQELFYELYDKGLRNSEIADILNKEIHNGKKVRDADKVHNFIIFAVRKGWLIPNRVNEERWTEEELIEVVYLASSAEELSKEEIAAELNKKFHQGKEIRTAKSVDYGINIAFSKGVDPLIGVKQ